MAIIKLINEPYPNSDALDNMFHYLASQKDLINDTSSLTDFMGGYNFNLYDLDTIAWQFQYVKEHFHKTNHRELIHFIISFPSYELSSVKAAHKFANYICRKYSYKFQILYAIHHKPNNLHIHFILNTISFVDGKNFYQLNGMPGALRYATNDYFGYNIAHFA